MKFINLNDNRIKAIVDCYINVFYPNNVNEKLEQIILDKLQYECTSFDLSIGAFKDRIAIGFILHTPISEELLYNLGMGVLDSYRGKKIGFNLYNYFITNLTDKYKSILLEVDTTNTFAISMYKKLGFCQNKIYKSYKGYYHLKKPIQKLVYTKIQDVNSLYNLFNSNEFEFQSTRHNKNFLSNNPYKEILLFKNEKEDLVGFAILSTISFEIFTIFIANSYRNQGYGKIILSIITYNRKNNFIYFSFVSEYSINTICFLKKIGLKEYQSQYELILNR